MSVVQRFAAAFNRQDVDGLIDCFTPTATYRDTFYGEHTGHAALRPMFERMFREGKDYRWTMEAVVESPDRAASEWTVGYVVTEAVPRSAGRRIRFRGMSLFDLEGDRIAAYREYFDKGAALLQLGFSPESMARVLARSI
jgi:steroid delta-isomerase-like uncharacterized protein